MFIEVLLNLPYERYTVISLFLYASLESLVLHLKYLFLSLDLNIMALESSLFINGELLALMYLIFIGAWLVNVIINRVSNPSQLMS